MTLIRKVSFQKENQDIFGNLITSEANNIIDIKHIDSLNEDLVYTLTENGGSVNFNKNTASAELKVNISGSKAVRQTRHLVYQSGKAFRATLTAVPMVGSINPNVRFEVGLFDDSNDKNMSLYSNQKRYGDGLFFRFKNGWSFVNRTSTNNSQVDNVINQSNWNLDKLDGTGRSGTTLDATKLNIFWIEFGWLSTLGFRFGIYHEGKKIIAHEEWHTNINDVPYMRTPNLPICYRLESEIGNFASVTSRMVCATVECFGGYEPTGLVYTANRGRSGNSISSPNTESLISIRLKDSFNKRSFEILKATVMATTGANGLAFLVVNPDFNTTPTWQDVGNDSGIEYSLATNYTVGTGKIISSGYLSNNQDQRDLIGNSIFLPSSNIEGKSDIITLAVTGVNGTETYYGSFDWKEYK